MLYSCNLSIGATGFDIGILCNPTDTSGFVYNQIHLGQVQNNRIGLNLRADGPGWCNENTFSGGRFAPKSTGAHSLIYIEYGTGTYKAPNNNRFKFPSLEGGPSTLTMVAAYIDGGAFNTLLHPRMEVTATLTKAKVWIQEQCFGYWIQGGLYLQGNSILNEGGQGYTNTSDGMMLSPYRGGAAQAGITIYRGDPNNDKVPVADLRDYYLDSQPAQGIRTVLGRYFDANSYHIDSNAAGTIVSHNPTGGDTKHYYECILTHVSTDISVMEPGAGSSWTTYWERLHNFGANNVHAGNGTNPWTIVGTPTYTGRTTQFKIGGTGKIITNQLGTHSAVSGTKKLLTVYDTNGTPYYIEGYPTKA
jgi:hypothetical protein